VADWPILNALLNAVAGATWVSVHHGGGVGMGYSIHAGMVVVADGTEEAERRLQRVLTTDPGTGVMRHCGRRLRAGGRGGPRARRAHPAARAGAAALKPPDLRRRGLLEDLLARARAAGRSCSPGLPARARPRRCARWARSWPRGLGPRLPRPHGRGLLAGAVRGRGPAGPARRAIRQAAGPGHGDPPPRGLGKARGADAVQALFGLWSSLDDAAGRPVVLLLDEATEIRSLAYFGGLRQVDKPFAAALAARGRGTVLATSYPTLARKLWPGLDSIEAGPLTPEDLGPAALAARVSPEALARASFGWPRYARVLIDAAGAGLAGVWAVEMAEGGRIESACRHTHESLLLRSRGYGCPRPCWRRWRTRRD
jgi:hypothetical protein